MPRRRSNEREINDNFIVVCQVISEYEEVVHFSHCSKFVHAKVLSKNKCCCKWTILTFCLVRTVSVFFFRKMWFSFLSLKLLFLIPVRHTLQLYFKLILNLTILDGRYTKNDLLMIQLINKLITSASNSTKLINSVN